MIDKSMHKNGVCFFKSTSMRIFLCFIFVLTAPSGGMAGSSEENCRDMMIAVESADRNKIVELVQDGLDINVECRATSKSIQAKSDIPLTPLIVAVENGDLSIVALLLDQGAEINKTVTIEDPEGRIHYLNNVRTQRSAREFKRVKNFSDIAMKKSPSRAIKKITISPLVVAILMENETMVSLLLKLGGQADNTYDIHYFDYLPKHPRITTYSPLAMAKDLKNNSIVLSLLEYDIDLDRDAELAPHYVLNFLIENNASIAEIEKALDLHLDVNRKSRMDLQSTHIVRDPLSLAIIMGDVGLVDFLIKRGAYINLDPKREEDDQRLYFLAANDPEMFRYLQKIGLKPLIPSFFSKTKGTPINIAVDSDDVEIITELIKMGFNPDTTNFRHAPVHKASMGLGNPDALKTLINNGANVNVRFTSQCGVFDYPCSPLEAQGRVTPLMFAVYHHPDPYETVELLIRNGAKIGLKTKSGLTAKDIWMARVDFCNHRKVDEKKFGTSFFKDFGCRFDKSDEITRLLQGSFSGQ